MRAGRANGSKSPTRLFCGRPDQGSCPWWWRDWPPLWHTGAAAAQVAGNNLCRPQKLSRVRRSDGCAVKSAADHVFDPRSGSKGRGRCDRLVETSLKAANTDAGGFRQPRICIRKEGLSGCCLLRKLPLAERTRPRRVVRHSRPGRALLKPWPRSPPHSPARRSDRKLARTDLDCCCVVADYTLFIDEARSVRTPGASGRRCVS